MWRAWRGNPVYGLLAVLPVAVGLHYAEAAGLWVFLASGLAIIPLAALMGRATECLAARLGSGVGGLLNATFGNAAELIIALVALRDQKYALVKGSLTGSIIGNALLVLGLALALGGFRYRRQTYNRTAASLGSTLLALAAVGLVIPAMYYEVFAVGAGPEARAAQVRNISAEIAALLGAVYVLYLVFILRTHRHLFAAASEAHLEGPGRPPAWSGGFSLGVLVAATAGVAVMSELLVGSLEPACKALGMSEVFVGVVVVAIVGNAAEHSTAVLVAWKNDLDLSLGIAVGSSIQVALFVAPVLVFANLAINGHVLDLHFTVMETLAVIISIGILHMVSQDGESNWLEGVMLLVVYAMLGVAFYHLPQP